ncbi:MAG: carboxymuconolactone decarboxylase family protein [Planctomycetota bacterium]|jgi:alkylhydroperoxidase family enzyme
MARIQQIEYDQAEGSLKKFYDDSLKRAGRIFGIVKLHSLRPDLQRQFIQFYATLMLGPGELPRWQREALAVVTSKTNECHY